MKFTNLRALILSLPFNETQNYNNSKRKAQPQICTQTNAQTPTYLIQLHKHRHIYNHKHEQYVKINKNIFATYTKLNNDSLLTTKPAHPSPKLKLASKLKT